MVTSVQSAVFSVSHNVSEITNRLAVGDVRVLVAEDVVLNQQYVTRLLKHIGVETFKIAAKLVL